MEIISSSGGESRTETQTTMLRWAVIDGDPRPPRLQQAWRYVVEASNGTKLRGGLEWRDIELVVVKSSD